MHYKNIYIPHSQKFSKYFITFKHVNCEAVLKIEHSESLKFVLWVRYKFQIEVLMETYINLISKIVLQVCNVAITLINNLKFLLV